MRMKSFYVLCCLLAAFLMAVSVQAGQKTHQVKKGEWLSQIATQYETSVKKIMEANDNIKDKNKIYPGQILAIPSSDSQEGKSRALGSEDEEAQTRKYTVRKGDSLWGISQKFGVAVEKLVKANPVIENPSFIRSGWEISIPESGTFYWKKVGADIFTSNPDDPEELKRGLRLLGFPREQVSAISSEVRNTKAETSILRKGDKLEAMVFSKNRVESPVICDFKGEEPVKIYQTPALEKAGYTLVVPLVCGNYSLVAAPKKEEAPLPKGRPPFPEVPTHPGDQEEETLERTVFEAYMGGGVDEPVHASGHNEHAWGKFRYRPFWMKLTDSVDVGFGLFAYGAIGSGRDDDYRYSWKRYSVGPNMKFVGENWDADFDLGIGAISNDGDEGRYESKQRDKIYHLSASYSYYERRNQGEKWFPETNVGFDATIPYDTDHKHNWDGQNLEPDPWDNQVVQLSFKQGIYDFRFDNDIRLTPEIHAGLGHSWGEEADFYKIGPGLSAGYKGYDILTLSVLNYQEYLGSDADNWSWASLTLDITNAYKAYKASRITKVN